MFYQVKIIVAEEGWRQIENAKLLQRGGVTPSVTAPGNATESGYFFD